MFGSIRSRLIYGSLALALIPLLIAVAVLGFISYREASTALEERLTGQLDSLRSVKASELSAYFDEVEKTMNLLVETPTVKDALVGFRERYAEPMKTTTISLEEQRAAVRKYFTDDFVANYAVRNGGAKIEMGDTIDSLPAEVIALQYHYIATNPNPLGKKNDLFGADGDTSSYTELHRAFHPYARQIIQQFGFYDIFLVDNDTGNIVYTYFKEADFGTSLVDGPYAGTNFGDAFLAGRDAERGTLTVSDFQPYLPSYDDPAAFVSMPVFAGDQRIGTLITQLPIDRINAVLNFGEEWEQVGLGKTGQVFVVGKDQRGRSLLRNLRQDRTGYLERLTQTGIQADLIASITARNSNVGLLPEPLPFLETMIGGESGVARYNHPARGAMVASYGPFKAAGLDWGIVAEYGQNEALAAVNRLLNTIGQLAAGIAVGLGILGFFLASRLANSINKPIAQISATVDSLQGGDFDARTRMQSTDELGTLSGALDRLLDERVAALNEQAKENEQLNNSVIEIMQAVGQLSQRDLTVKVPVTADVTGAVADAINLMTSETSQALRQVFSISANVAQASSRVKQRSDAVLSMAEQSGAEVGAASDELASVAQVLARIADDAQSANNTAAQAIQATQEALRIVSETAGGVSASRETIRETEKRLKRLGERSQEISSVVSIISNIAERTSILALNASMQAVAAGEAGRGFAVVADEVKRLAENAREATQQITNLVGGIQADTVEAIQSMNNAISQVVDISKLAERAGEQMQATKSSTDRLVGSVRDIAILTAEQSKVSDTLIRRAEQISNSTKGTLQEVAQQNEESSKLLQFARNLLDTVRQFKLPNA